MTVVVAARALMARQHTHVGDRAPRRFGEPTETIVETQAGARQHASNCQSAITSMPNDRHRPSSRPRSRRPRLWTIAALLAAAIVTTTSPAVSLGSATDLA